MFAQACAASIVVDVVVPRAGLVSAYWWRSDLTPLSFSILSGIAYDVCLRSCLSGYEGAPGRFTLYWLKGVIRTKDLGNPGMGSLFLLALQASSLGLSLRTLESDSIIHVMGSTSKVIDEAGSKGALDFLRVLHIVSPSYIGRISYGGLPDVTSRTCLEYAKRLSLREVLDIASLYDPVARDAVRFMTYSLGYAYETILEEGVIEGVKKANYCLASWLGDLVSFRKVGATSRVYEEACRGADIEEALLWSILKEGGGPASTADIVVNALARVFYDFLAGRITLPRFNAKATM